MHTIAHVCMIMAGTRADGHMKNSYSNNKHGKSSFLQYIDMDFGTHTRVFLFLVGFIRHTCFSTWTAGDRAGAGAGAIAGVGVKGCTKKDRGEHAVMLARAT